MLISVDSASGLVLGRVGSDGLVYYGIAVAGSTVQLPYVRRVVDGIALQRVAQWHGTAVADGQPHRVLVAVAGATATLYMDDGPGRTVTLVHLQRSIVVCMCCTASPDHVV